MKCAKRDKARGGLTDFLSFFKKIERCAKREKRVPKGTNPKGLRLEEGGQEVKEPRP